MINVIDFDNYEVGAVDNEKAPVVVLLCHRDHAQPGPWVGVVARDLDGDQTGLTLAELIEAANEHEAEHHSPRVDT